MNRNRLLSTLAALLLTVGLAFGLFLALGSGSETATAEDSATTNSAGEAALTFEPEPGTYLVVADEREGYTPHNDKDGEASHIRDKVCTHTKLCIYLTATQVTHADNTTSVEVEISHVTAEQKSELDDLWFEMKPNATVIEEEDDLISIGQDPVSIEDDDSLISTGPGEFDGPPEAGLSRFCADVRHTEVAEQSSPSGIWVRGSVFGLSGGWVWVEGPTINGGAPVRLPVDDGCSKALSVSAPTAITPSSGSSCKTLKEDGPSTSFPLSRRDQARSSMSTPARVRLWSRSASTSTRWKRPSRPQSLHPSR